MLIDDENIRVQYDSTAESPIMAGDALPFPFRFIEKEQVKAILLDGTKLVFNEDYTVGLEEEEEEKPEGEDEASVSSDYTSVILNIDIPIGETITLYRETDLDQTSEFPQEARFSSRKIEDALDKLTMQNQEQREALGRAMKLPLTAAVDLKDLALPNPEPNKSVKWNSDGTALVNTNFDPDTALVTTENFKKQAEQSAKDSANSASASANSATVAGQKVNEITSLHSNYMEDINTTSTNYLNQINSRGNTIIKDADAIINRVGFTLFDTVVKDHVLTFPDGKGLALQGTWVYKEAISGERYGYPDFYNKCLEEYKDSENQKQWLKSNVTEVGSLVDNQGVLSGFSTSNYAQMPVPNVSNAENWEMVYKVKLTSTPTATCNIIAGSSANQWLVICVTSASKVGFAVGTGSAWSITETTALGSTVLSPNKDYWVKMVFTGQEYVLSLSEDGKTYNVEYTYTSSEKLPYEDSYDCNLGLNRGSSANPWLGTIDLNASYIDIDGSRWWSGVETYIRNSNGHMFYDIANKIDVDNIFATTGMAWMYGVDEENERIFLPRNVWFEQMSMDDVGKAIEAGLPNITGVFVPSQADNGGWAAFGASSKKSISGAFYLDSVANRICLTETGNNWSGGRLCFDASRSNSIYNNSDTVQPNAVKKLLYICVGNQVQDSSWVNVANQVQQGVKDLDDKRKDSIASIEQTKTACINAVEIRGAELRSKMSLQMFDTITKDHVLTYEETVGLALQGTYVYKNALAGSYHGYPDFYNKCVQEMQDADLLSLTDVAPLEIQSYTATSGWSNVANAFDGNTDTYAACGTDTDYIECTFASATTLTGVIMTGWWADSVARSCNIAVYSVAEDGTQTLLGKSTNAADKVKTYTASISVNNVSVTKIRVSLIAGKFGEPTTKYKTRVRELKFTGAGSKPPVYYYKHSNGHLYYDILDKSAFDERFNENGSAWFYGVDTTNERIFLPRSINRYLVESKKPTSSDAYWYNLYSDGWLEQGGLVTGSNAQKVTVTFPKSFITLPTVLINFSYSGEGASYYQYLVAHSITTTKFVTTVNASSSQGTMWRACGYTDKPTLSENFKEHLYICVGTTIADTSWVDVTTQVQNGTKDIEDKRVQSLSDIERDRKQALTDLTNKEKAGLSALANASNALRETQITNCIKEIPQNIKLELNDGKLTLKAGSKVIVPNGAGVFDEVVVDKDLNLVQTWGTANASMMLFYANGSLTRISIDRTTSGDTSSYTGSNSYIWYDTTNNWVKWVNTDGTYSQARHSLPICSFTVVGDNTSTVTSIDQIFNGLGYIGSTIWVDKGVKGLIPNGRNADGTLNNIEMITDKVATFTYTFGIDIVNDDIWFSQNGDIGRLQKEYTFEVNTFNDLSSNTGNNQYRTAYVIEDNIHYMTSDTGVSWEQVRKVGIATCNTSLNTITSFQLKKPFRAVDYNNVDYILEGMIPDYTAGVSRTHNTDYVATETCWIYLYVYSSSSNSNSHVARTIYIDDKEAAVLSVHSWNSNCCMVPCKKGSKYRITNVNTGTGGYTVKVFPVLRR